MKKNCLIYGNCQADALKVYFSRITNFEKKYNILDLKPIHNLNRGDLPIIKEYLKKLDLFIYQPISDNYKGIPELSTKYILSKISESCQTISFPVCYFTGYSPELIGLKTIKLKSITKPFSYFNSNFLHDQFKGETIEYSINNLKDSNFYSKEFVTKNLLDTISNLKKRESHLDIKLSSYIEANYKKEKLFHTFNHPNSSLLHHLCKSILEKIHDVDHNSFDNLPDKVKKLEMLGRNQFPTYASITKHLELNFRSIEGVIIAKNKITLKEYILTQQNFLNNNKELIEHNLRLQKII